METSKDNKHALSATEDAIVHERAHSIAKGGSIPLDEAILQAQGHGSAMPRRFYEMGLLRFWIQNLVYGGPQVVVFSLLAAAVVQWIVTLGLSELASAFPSTGGQYHFTYIVAPHRMKCGLAFMYILDTGVLEYWMIAAPVFLFPKAVPKIAQITMYLSVIGFFANFIVLVVMKKHTNPGSYIVQSGLGSSGWSAGTAWALGVTNSMYAYAATDSAIDIAEECPSPQKVLPFVMNVTMTIGFSTAFPLFVLLMFGMTDLDAVVNAGLPSAEVMYQVTGSKAVSTFLMCWVLLVYVLCVIPQWITCGRTAWALATDNGTPFAQYFSHIDTTKDFPVRTTVCAVVFVCIYGLLYLASTTAYNSIVTGAVLCLNITYAIPQTIMLLRGRSKCLLRRHLELGRTGYFCNLFSPLWVIVLAVLVCLPPSGPQVEVSTMNWTSPILAGLFLVTYVLWLVTGRHKFYGPKIDWDALNLSNGFEMQLDQ
ncbi:hypothetical protein UA08_08017 [Talaromyces atroroseus]|uniref:Amino-acid permease n=1 Tax=Talaromyces atroroseus TaxID=1441469 RepID=A0A225AQJ0_TALAT|nr:hypothetical protein UA08_08017 [Talaromyces atroroseus]OKL56695.1 hypothetical protein UA08_08017 [Talaromyces atroroseus]